MDNATQKPLKVPAPVAPSAWLVRSGKGVHLNDYLLSAACDASTVAGMRPGDGMVLVEDISGKPLIVKLARLYRTRLTSGNAQFFLDGLIRANPPQFPEDLGVALNASTPAISRLDWSVFEGIFKHSTNTEFSALPVLEGKGSSEQAYIREMLQFAVMDDLLGPAGGPTEEIVGMSVRDRYLVGKLAPQTKSEDEYVEGLQGPSALDKEGDGRVPADLQPFEEVGDGKNKGGRRNLPGEEFAKTAGTKDSEGDEAMEVDASKNQSFVPSSLGFTICVDGSITKLELEARWGRYARTTSEEQADENGKPLRAWKRIPSGGKIPLELKPGPIRPFAIDPECPKVFMQGVVRPPLPSGEKLITIFLVNDQLKPDQNQDEAWLFQPELALRHPEGKASFLRRPVAEGANRDEEQAALGMIYRRRVEFAVGHGVAVHAETPKDDVERAVEIRTRVLPSYEVAVTETPGAGSTDRPIMRKLAAEKLLDMRRLAEMEQKDLLATLGLLADDYEAWISEQLARIGKDVVGHDASAKPSVDRCSDILKRLREGISTLKSDEKAFKAFRLANFAMADQRIHGIHALRRRRGETGTLSEVDIPSNRSWRPFQLAFMLLSIASIADPAHGDRTKTVDAVADLLWFPTGGGKTEAYLGVAAFTMAIRRLQGDLGGFDASRGLSVIMRYTLRLLTVQQFQRATTLICAMEVLRRKDEKTWGRAPFTIGLWVGQRVTPNDTESSHEAIEAERTGKRPMSSSPAQLASCPWCGAEIAAGREIEVRRFSQDVGRTLIYCGDKLGRCDFSRANSKDWGLPVVVVDDEIYRRPPSMLIATVDKFAMMAWRGQVRTLFGKATEECPRHGLLWPGSDCNGRHQKRGGLPMTDVKKISPIRPPDLIIQDELHLISGPLGTMVALYEAAVDDLATWKLGDKSVRPKVIASTATVRKAAEQTNSIFLRRVAVFPPHGLDVEDNFFSVQRPVEDKPGRRYLGICSPGSARPAVLIRVYTALLTAAEALFERFGSAADPWMTVVGYFNSLRELGGMRRLAEDDVQTRSFRVQMSRVARPGLAQRNVKVVDELTSRVSNKDIPSKLDQLELSFKGAIDPATGRYRQTWTKGDPRAIDVVLATNMLGVGVDVIRLGLMVVNGQPKSTAEYIQATSRVGRFFPGLVCSVLTWSRPRDLSHYETFEHYHGTFYKHVEAQSVTPFAPRALDRGLTGAMVGWLRLGNNDYNPNLGAEKLDSAARPEVARLKQMMSHHGWKVTDSQEVKKLVEDMIGERCDEWAREATRGGRRLGYEAGKKRKAGEDDVAALLKRPGFQPWDVFTVPLSLREVEAGVRLVMDDGKVPSGPTWKPKKLGSPNGGPR